MSEIRLWPWLLLSLALLSGCTADEMSQSNRNEISVKFSVSASESDVRSSLSVQEDQVKNVNLFAYCDGTLDNGVYSDGSTGIVMELQKDKTYNIYALANMGRISAPSDEEDMKAMKCEFASISDFSDNGLPLASVTELGPDDIGGSVVIFVRRLVAKVNFAIDTDELSGLSVTSVRIMQGALDVSPFSSASAATTVADGDYASSKDITSVNNGGTASFYVLENCQGVLLPNNTDQWSKVPDNIPDKADLCTYIEVGADFDGTSGILGSVIYRFFLGQDNITDFNVYRNTESTVTLKVTSDGLEETSWRIDNSGIVYEDVEIKYTMNAPEYVGQWGSITFPEATEENPVTITFYGSSITIPSSTSQHLGDETNEPPDLVVYIPSSSKNTVYTCQGVENMDLSITQRNSTQTLTVSVNDDISWAAYSPALGDYVGDTVIELCDDGADYEIWLYLSDYMSGEVLYAKDFAMPEAVRSYLDAQGNRECPDIKSHLYWYFDPAPYVDGVSGGFSYDSSAMPALECNEGENYLFVFYLYGKVLDDNEIADATFECSQNFLLSYHSETYKFKIYPSFPDQRHIGETFNYILALKEENLYSNESELTLFESYQGTKKATWYIAKGSEYEEGDNERDFGTVMEDYGHALVSARVSGRNMTLTYSAPTTIGQYQYVAGGTYHIRGVVTNTNDGDKKIIGDYSVDIILHLVVGAEVSFWLGEKETYPNEDTFMDITYLPVVSRCGETDEEAFRDTWNITCDWCKVLPENFSTNIYRALGTPVYTDIQIPLDVIESHYTGSYDDIKGLSDYVKNVLLDKGKDFTFYDVKNDIAGAPLRMTNSEVYVEAYRLQDVTDYYLIEDYYGSYDNY